MDTTEQRIYSVFELNHDVNALLSQHFTHIWVAGEISNLTRPASGHLYFSLKDSRAQIRCALFRFQHQQIGFQLENGQSVIVRAQAGVYEARGDFQLIVTDVKLAGLGELQIAFEQLKIKLEKAGLFDDTRKKSFPTFPKQIGIITSPTAAALQDILKVLKKRMPAIPILIYPTLVQGDQAAGEIIAAIARANHDQECDALILARGGGSLEDLWPFNEEKVAHAIFNSAIPIVSGIGHQTDFTIADFVSDLRAPTPSAAAEMISPDCTEILETLSHYDQRLLQNMRAQLHLHQTNLLHLQKRLQHPGEKLRQQAQQLDQCENQLRRAMDIRLQFSREKIAHMAQVLENLSPLTILKRGFSITRDKKTGDVIRSVKTVSAGDTIVTRLNDGEVLSIVIH